MNVGLALSGGGAKGAAHIGVLQALKEENIQIDCISGNSSASIVATLYASGYNPYNILHIFNNYCAKIADYDKMLPFKVIGTMITGKISVCSLAKGDNLEYFVRNFCAQKNIINIADIKMPIVIPTVDLNTGQIVYFTNYKFSAEYEEKLYKAGCICCYDAKISGIIRASSSFPGVFAPKYFENRVLVDGGVRVNTPVSILKYMSVKKVIAVDFEEDRTKFYSTNKNNIINIAMKSFDIMGNEINKKELKLADIILVPKVGQVGLLQCNNMSAIATRGYEVVKQNIKYIKQNLEL